MVFGKHLAVKDGLQNKNILALKMFHFLQEIDGVSLLLLKRSDVLKGLDMKLGPALKVNRLVQGLQTARQGIL